jgi:O-antigen ligase
MKIAPYPPAERVTTLAIAAAAAAIFVLPPWPRLCVAVALIVLPFVVWTAFSPGAWLGLFLGAVLILPPVPVSIGNSGAHPALVLVTFGVYAGLVFAHRWKFARSPVIAPLVLLTVMLAASVPMALFYSGSDVAIGSAVRVALFAITPFVLAYVLWGPGRALANCGFGPAYLLFAGGVLSAAFACVDFFYQLPAPAGYSPQFIWLSDRVLRRAQGPFYDAGALGNMCAFFLVMAAVAMFRTPAGGMKRWLAAAGAIPLSIALLFSYSRASVLCFLVAVMILLWLQRREVKWIRTALPLLGAVVVAAILVSSLVPGLAERWLQRAWQTFELAFSGNNAALSGRVASWQTILTFATEHPFRGLAGVGYKSLPYSDVLGQPLIADNTYLSTWIETGIGGLAALLALHVAILRATYRAARSANPSVAFYGLWTFSFWVGEAVQMAAADLLTYWRLLPVFFFVIGVAVLKVGRTPA